MGIFKNKTDKHENKLLLMALLIGLIGVLSIIIGFISVFSITNDDGGSTGGNTSTQGYYGTYHTTMYSQELDSDLQITLIISATSCKFTFETEVQGINASFTDNCTYQYITSTVAQINEKNTQYEGCNALLLHGDSEAKVFTETTVLWIIKEQEGNYQFAISSDDDNDMIFS